MLNKEYIENLTKMYVYSYNAAMQEVKNPNLAVQVAMSVILAIHTTEQQKHSAPNPFEALVNHIAAQALAQEGEQDVGKDKGLDD